MGLFGYGTIKNASSPIQASNPTETASNFVNDWFVMACDRLRERGATECSWEILSSDPETYYHVMADAQLTVDGDSRPVRIIFVVSSVGKILDYDVTPLIRRLISKEKK
jgi:hypothetical protein